MRSFLFYWLPPILLMSIIFFLSSRQSISVDGGFTTNFLIFKSMHIGEYALLTALFFRALFKTTKLKLSQVILWAFIFSFCYAISDELHQTFVPTRTGQVRDLYVDLIGITGTLIFIRLNFDIIKKYLR